MNEKEELQALRRLAELEAKAGGSSSSPSEPEKGPITRLTSGIGGELLKAASGITGSETLNEMAKEGLSNATGFAGGAGKLVGSSLPYYALPAGGVLKTAAMSGLLSGATTPGDMEERANNALTTAAGSAVVGNIANAIKGFKASDAAKELISEGVQPTVGQGIDKSGILGKTIGRVEEAAKSIPGVGQAIEHARDRAVTEWGHAIVKKAEVPSLNVSAAGETGSKAIDSLQKTYSAAYKNTLSPHVINKDSIFNSKINSIIRANPGVAKGIQVELDTLPKRNLTADQLNSVASSLRAKSERYLSSPLASEKEIGDSFKSASNFIKTYISQKIPEQAANDFKALDQHYGLFKTMQKAATSLGAREGEFSGKQLLSAVRALDKKKDKSNFGRGAARLKKDAETAIQVLGNTLNDSGTAIRSTLTGAALTGAYFNPATAAKMAIGIPAAWVGQTKPVQKALLGGYDKQEMIADIVRRLTQPAAAGVINE